MPNSDGKVIIDTELDTTNFKNGLSKFNSSIGGLKATLKRIGTAVGVAFGAKALLDFGKAAIDLGSDIAEVQNVVDTAFGDMAYKAEAFAETAIEQFGMSKLAAKKTASTYMAMARGIGMSADRASDMAVSLAGLTGDVASFFNISQELADVKLKSVFTGETETLKDLGVVMTQTNLNAFALANGFGKTIDKMTQAEQVELRYKYVTQQLAIAQGDFAKTSDSWANQTRILSENWKEFMSSIGQSLITVLTPALKTLNAIVAALARMANTVNVAIASFFGGAPKQIGKVAAATETMETAISGSASGADDLAQSTAKAEKAAKGVFASFDEINVLSSKSSNNSAEGGVRGSGGAITLPNGIIETEENHFSNVFHSIGDAFQRYLVQPILKGFHLFDKPVAKFKALFKEIGKQCKAWLAPLSKWFQNDFSRNISESILTIEMWLSGLMVTLSEVSETIWNAIKPIIDWLIIDGLPTLSSMWSEWQRVVQEAMNNVKDLTLTVWKEAIDPFFQFVSRTIVDVLTTLKDAWDEYGTPITNQVIAAIQSTKETLLNFWNQFLKPIWDSVISALDGLWAEHLQPLVEKISEFVGKAAEAALTFYNNVILPLIDWIVNVFGPPISKVIQSIIEKVKSTFAVTVEVSKSVISVLGSILDFLSAVFSGEWESAWNAICDIFRNVWDGMKNIVKAVVNNIISMINSMLQKVESGVNSITGAINGLTGLVGIPEIPTLAIRKIPKLAQGAVIPPNREFMAVLGDQKQGTNIEAPLETIIEAIRQAFPHGSGTGDITVILELDKREFGRAVVKASGEENRRMGVSLAY